MGFVVQSAAVTGRWVPKELQQQVADTLGVGKKYDPANLSAALELVRNELVKSEERFMLQITKGSTSVLYIDAQVCDVSDSLHPNQVQVNIRPYYLRIDLINIGNNVLPVPRTARVSFLENVPFALLATSPVLGFINDRQYGSGFMVNLATDLLHPPGTKTNGGPRSLRLDLQVNARKSFTNPFYTAGGNIILVHPAKSDSTLGWNAGFRYLHEIEPLGDAGQYKRSYSWLFAAIQGNGKIPFLNRYTIGGGVRFLNNQYYIKSANSFENTERSYEFYALSDGRIKSGFSRFGIWFDASDPEHIGTLASYQRIASKIAYGVSLGKNHNNVDLEVVAGGGHTWGTSPSYSQFFAGNTAWNFLYEPFISTRTQSFPEGPVIRSLGEKEGGLVTPSGNMMGGSSYWHLNTSFSIPIGKWSRPLIPDIVIDEGPPTRTLRTVIKGQSKAVENQIIGDLVDNQGMPDDDATATIAKKIVDKDIRPALNYLADRANIYSIKPLLMADIAQVRDKDIGSKTWLGLGAGVQLNVVIARLEAGYMQTILPSPESSKGNFFLRFTLQNFY